LAEKDSLAVSKSCSGGAPSRPYWHRVYLL